MAHLHLVHSAPASTASGGTCLDAFDRELDYVFETLRRLGAAPSEIEDLAQDVFLVLHRTWPTLDATRALRTFLFEVALRIVCAHRPRLAHRYPHPAGDTEDATGVNRPDLPLDPAVAVLLELAKTIGRVPNVVRARLLARARAIVAAAAVFPPVPLPAPRDHRLGLASATLVAFAVGALIAVAALCGRTPDAGEPAPASTAGAVPSVRYTTSDSPPVRPTATPRGSSTAKAGPTRSAIAEKSYAAELDLLERAQAACAGRDFSDALVLVAEHGRLFPKGRLAEEREALRVRSLASSGHVDEARRIAAAFTDRFPRSVLLQRSQALSQTSD